MERLSSSLGKLKAHYPIVVIGSGYGGAIVAARLAQAGHPVCVLERGREFQPGEYPDTPSKVLRELQVHLPGRASGSRTGLYDLRIGEDMTVFVGCGLGGTSLINANVSLWPDEWVFERWPLGLRDPRKPKLAEGRDRAWGMFSPVRYPHPPPLKLRALEMSAKGLSTTADPVRINVAFKSRANPLGFPLSVCQRCGDCMTGCNYDAKGTVLMNYLPMAKRRNAEIYTQVAVRFIERREARWLVHYELLDSGRETFGAPPMFLTADLVILAAGTLGSTEILLRSRRRGLRVSPRVGDGLSGNGDALAFGYNADKPVNGVGAGRRWPNEREPVGPCITGIIDLRHTGPRAEGLLIEEGSLPGAASAFLPLALAAASVFGGEPPGEASRKPSLAREARRLWRTLWPGPAGATAHTQTFLVVSHDNARGRMRLDDRDRLRITWPDTSKSFHERINRVLRAANNPLGSMYLESPFGLTTVHPLGGCCMAETASQGVVTDEGRVFSGVSGTDAYETLYVCDGSVVPSSLGVNPLLTISALAERTAALLRRKLRP